MRLIKRLIGMVMMVSLMAIVGGVSAFIESISEAELDTVRSGEIENVAVEINSTYDLTLASVPRFFDDPKYITSANERIVLKLMTDIFLTAQLVIESDVNIDFNGFFIDLMGNNLIFRHSFSGNVTLKNGSVINSGDDGFLYFDLPNAEVVMVDFSSDYLSFVYDFPLLCAEIFALLDSQVPAHCKDDLMLPLTYKHYPLELIYESSNQSLIDSFGRVTRPAFDTPVTLTLTIFDMSKEGISDFDMSKEGTDFNMSKEGTSDFDMVKGGTLESMSHQIEVTVLGTETDLGLIGLSFLDAFLEDYRFTEQVFDLSHDEFLALVEDYGFNDVPYIYFNNIVLPTIHAYYGLSIDYQLSYVIGEETITEPLEDGLLSLRQSNCLITLIATIHDPLAPSKTNDRTSAIPPSTNPSKTNDRMSAIPQPMEYPASPLGVKSYEFYSLDNHIVASGIIDNLGAVVLAGEIGSSFSLAESLMTSEHYNIYDLSFSLPSEVGLYALSTSDSGLVLELISLPEESGNFGFLRLSLSFKNGTPSVITKDIPIYVSMDAGGGGVGLAGIDRAYFLILERLNSQSEQIANFLDFTLQSKISHYDIAYAFRFSDKALNEFPFMAMAIETLDSEYTFGFNLINIPPLNTSVSVDIYFDGVLYSKTLSFDLCGVVSNSRPLGFTAEVGDAALYAALMQEFDQNADNILILNELLNSTKTSFSMEGSGEVIKSFRGLEYLKTVTELTLVNLALTKSVFTEFVACANKTKITSIALIYVGVGDEWLSELSKLVNLRELDLSFNLLTSLDYLPVLGNLKYINLVGNALKSYKNINFLPNLEELEIEKSEPSIAPFFLLKNLKTVHIHDYSEHLKITTTLNKSQPTLPAAQSLAPRGATREGAVSMQEAFYPINFTKYIMLCELGLRFNFNGFQVLSPIPEEFEAAAILESVVYFTAARVIILPSVIAEQYGLIWQLVLDDGQTIEIDSSCVIDIGGQAVTVTSQSDKITLSNLPTGTSLKFWASVSNYYHLSLMREFIITVN